MSERKCEMHGALVVEWDTEDIPDDHCGDPRCYVCELTEEIEALKHSLKVTEKNRDNWESGWKSQREEIRRLEALAKAGGK